MASMMFKKTGDERLQKFDSSPLHSITKMHGYSTVGFRVERTGGDNLRQTWDVYAAATDDGPVHKVGVLTSLTREAIWAGQHL